MRRREFVAGLAFPFLVGAASAQPSGSVYRIAVVHPSAPTSELSEDGNIPAWRVFFKELSRLGYSPAPTR